MPVCRRVFISVFPFVFDRHHETSLSRPSAPVFVPERFPSFNNYMYVVFSHSITDLFQISLPYFFLPDLLPIYVYPVVSIFNTVSHCDMYV